MRLRDKCHKQRREIERLWKMVEWPQKVKRFGGTDIIVASKAFSLTELRQAFDAEEQIDCELQDLKESIMREVGKGII